MTKEEKSWILYDVGNSAFTLLISTIMPIYFNYLADNAGVSSVDYLAYWGYAASIATLAVALLGPVFGTLADTKGFKKPIFLVFLLVGAFGCVGLGLAKHWLAFLVIFVIARVGYSGSLIFYDSMLPDVTDRERLDGVSSQGYAWGYIGSCIPFVICLGLFSLFPGFPARVAIMTLANFLIYGANGYGPTVAYITCSALALQSIDTAVVPVLLERLLYTAVGGGIALLANHFIFPIRLKNQCSYLAEMTASIREEITDLLAHTTPGDEERRFQIDQRIVKSYLIFKRLENMYSIFDTHLVSKNTQYYTVKESTTSKRVKVTINYFLAPQYAQHVSTVGPHVPFVKSYAELDGHIRDSLTPSIEDYETELKEELYTHRFNYFETIDENVFQRATQSTSQTEETDLVEENNVTVLYEIKRIIEKDVQQELYNFADDATRSSFAAYQKARFAPWVGVRILSLDISFTANKWEAEHSIVHCYLAVVFRGLQKRAIVEIDINKRSYATGEAYSLNNGTEEQ